MTRAPYFERDGVRIFHGDALEVLADLATEYAPADLIVTDPPYGIADVPIDAKTQERADGTHVRHGETCARSGALNTWHPPSTWDRELAPEWLALALRCFPTVAMFGHWRKRTAFEAAAGMEPRCEIVWAKDTHVGPPCPLGMRDERVWVFSHAPLKPTRFETSVWDSPIIPTWGHRWHKNEKPLALMKRLVSWLPGAHVLDPFMGSGSTLIAARDVGRLATGVEADERHCEAAAKRLAQGVLDFDNLPGRIRPEPSANGVRFDGRLRFT